MFWREFPTKKTAEQAIRSIVNSQPFKIPFESPLISDLILERHYFCSLRGLRPSRFRKLPGYGAYTFEGDFSGLPTPVPIGWHPVSWAKCLAPPVANWDRIVRAKRDRIEPLKMHYRDRHPICEACNRRPAVEVHHSNPSFLSIADSVRSRVSDSEVSECLGSWNWFLRDNFTLPDDDRITIIFDELHSTATLQALCRECHNETKRRLSQPDLPL